MISGLVLASCAEQSSTEVLEQDRKKQEQNNSVDFDAQNFGRPLTDAASKSMSSHDSIKQNLESRAIDDDLKAYIGRYQAVISCEDPIVQCEQGDAEFILNLLEDGTAHRTIVHLGRLSSKTNNYYDDHWSYDKEDHQIIIHRGQGLFFFYDIDVEGGLLFNIGKTINFSETNRTYFEDGHPIPKRTYRLEKIK